MFSSLPHTDADAIGIKSIESRPSFIGYLAKSIALVGKGERHKAYRVCDIAFEHVHSSHLRFLLLVKVCIPCVVRLPFGY